MSEYFFNFEKMAYLKTPKPEGCIICLIIEKSDKVQDLTVWENEHFITMVNLYPYNPGHLLVAPKRHITDIRALNPSEELQLHALQRRFLTILDKIYAPSAYNIGFNMGLPAGASIEHLHLHIIPRYPRETGIADLIAGKRVLVESPLDTMNRIKELLRQNPFHL